MDRRGAGPGAGASFAYGQPPVTLTVPAGKSVEAHWDLSCSNQWYDFQLTAAGNASWLRRIAGHVETGKPSITDPAATAPVTKAICEPGLRIHFIVETDKSDLTFGDKVSSS